jgi:hypothetical protein
LETRSGRESARGIIGRFAHHHDGPESVYEPVIGPTIETTGPSGLSGSPFIAKLMRSGLDPRYRSAPDPEPDVERRDCPL